MKEAETRHVIVGDGHGVRPNCCSSRQLLCTQAAAEILRDSERRPTVAGVLASDPKRRR